MYIYIILTFCKHLTWTIISVELFVDKRYKFQCLFYFIVDTDLITKQLCVRKIKPLFTFPNVKQG